MYLGERQASASSALKNQNSLKATVEVQNLPVEVQTPMERESEVAPTLAVHLPPLFRDPSKQIGPKGFLHQRGCFHSPQTAGKANLAGTSLQLDPPVERLD